LSADGTQVFFKEKKLVFIALIMENETPKTISRT